MDIFFSSISFYNESIKKENADVSIGKFCKVMDRFGLIKKEINSNLYNNKIITKNQLMNEYYDSFCGWGEFPVNIWAKLYKKSLIDSVNYRSIGISHGEDLCFNIQVLPYANKIVSILQCIYFYRWSGMTNKINKNLFKDACIAYNFKLQIFKEQNSNDSYAKASVGLCNFFKGYIDTYLKFSNLNQIEIEDLVKKEIQNKDLQKAVRIPEYDWFLSNETYQCIKKQDVEGFLNILKKGLAKRRLKNKALFIISKILN